MRKIVLLNDLFYRGSTAIALKKQRLNFLTYTNLYYAYARVAAYTSLEASLFVNHFLGYPFSTNFIIKTPVYLFLVLDETASEHLDDIQGHSVLSHQPERASRA